MRKHIKERRSNSNIISEYEQHSFWIRVIVLVTISVLAIYNIVMVINPGNIRDKYAIGISVVMAIIVSVCITLIVIIQGILRENSAKQLEKMAFYDSLTGIFNKNSYYVKMDEKIDSAKRNNTQLGVLIVGIDNLKKINDIMGHQVGDMVVKTIATRLMAIEGEKEVFRLSGDEFVITIENVSDIQQIEVFANEIKDCLLESINSEEKPIHITASVGYSVCPSQADDAKTLLQYADIAIAHAKGNGKNQSVMFKNEMGEQLGQRMDLEQRIIKAIVNEEFEMYYQPQYEFRTKKFRGFEALIRWNDSELGWISPEKFIPIAEETGYIVEIGQWVLKEVCSTWKMWKDLYNHTGLISVNVSAVQLTKEGFVDMVRDVLLENNMNPAELELEITESVFINDIDRVLGILKELKALGIRLSLDDFGTGYSSLTYLKDLPMDTLKIDKSFISNITENNRQAEIADALIELVHKLNMETIAEGVETKEQYDFLKYMKCDNIQGYYTGKPMSKHDAEGIVDNCA